MLDRDWTTDLPTWPFPNTTIEFGDITDETEATRWRPRTDMAIAAAVAMGLALGGLAWALWRGRDRVSTTAPAIVHVPAPAPALEGALLWLPPLDHVRLLDRSRTRRVSLDRHSWPDGSSKLEPPMLRKSKCNLAWPAPSSLRSIRILA
jgi:hypothetical protein